ncbi:hypothetical protein Goarm_023137 [Gossypium armourianum]|uniref:Retrovirus-related Pol polyprotein from transposon TNT 1-94 n=1 Tax=Gossypium armourianum TaxID=34283 RepID=A0A7J9KET8_9ROSI|nr:hypothetical protein [Gossypium armourianum]
MTTTRFEIEKFDGVTNFNLWQVRMMTILVQIGLKKVIIGKKLKYLNQTKWEELDEVLMENTSSALWKRLETLYAIKFLANRLLLKQYLFAFHINECELLRDHIS